MSYFWYVMTSFYSLIYLIYILIFPNAEWGQTGHRVVGEIAQQHLTQKAQNRIGELLEGRSLASVSTYGDDIKSDPKYKLLNPWHYVNLPLEISYSDAQTNPKGDVVMAIQKCIAKIKDPDESRGEKVFYLKLLVHFVGDLHQPMHVGRQEDRGGNDIRLKWFGQSTNLHRLWDSHLIDSHGMSYTELAHDMKHLSPQAIDEIQKQPLETWVEEAQSLAKTIYEATPPDSTLGYEYRYRFLPLLKMQLQKGGLRLAAQLNEIFK